MASAGKAVAGLGVGLVALLALMLGAKTAKAAPGPSQAPDDLYSPEACAAYKNARYNLLQTRAAINQQQVEAQQAALEAAQNDDDAAAGYYSSLANQLGGQKAQVQAQINDLDSKIAKCA